MALQEGVISLTLEAGSDLSADQFKGVIIAADGQVDLNGVAGGPITGILQNDPDAAGKAATVGYFGVSKVIYGGTITAGNKIQINATGLAELAASADHVVGTALVSGVINDVGSVLLTSQHILG